MSDVVNGVGFSADDAGTVRSAFKLLKDRASGQLALFSPGEWRGVMAAEGILDGFGSVPAAPAADVPSADVPPAGGGAGDDGAFPDEFPHAATLLSGGVLSLAHLTMMTRAELDAVKGVGPVSMGEIEDALGDLALTLRADELEGDE